MKFSRDDTSHAYRIHSYGPGGIRVITPDATEPVTIADSLAISPDRLLRDWGPQQFEELQSEHLAQLLELQPELLLLGTGGTLRFPEKRLLAPLYEAGLGVEIMDTGAACRTFNILAGEGRRVVAALLMIEES